MKFTSSLLVVMLAVSGGCARPPEPAKPQALKSQPAKESSDEATRLQTQPSDGASEPDAAKVPAAPAEDPAPDVATVEPAEPSDNNTAAVAPDAALTSPTAGVAVTPDAPAPPASDKPAAAETAALPTETATGAVPATADAEPAAADQPEASEEARLAAIRAAALQAKEKFDPAAQPPGRVDVGEHDWPQWGGSPARNNVVEAKDIPDDWDVGQFDPDTGEWDPTNAHNIKWVARLGSQTYGNTVVANGKVYVGTNNGAGYLKRYPPDVDLGVLLCFNEADGKFLWQDSSEKLPTGRVHDWPLQGICCSPLVEGNRLWYVTSRGEVKCLDTEGFHNGVNTGPFKDEPNENLDEADVIWVLDMMKELGVSQHNMASCSVTAVGDLLFVNTSNGVDEGHINLPAVDAPSFICVDKNTGKVIWADNSPGANILHGQWSSPAFGVFDGVPQVLFGGGDGWLYSFLGTAENENGRPKLLWKFDCNPKESKYVLGGRADRNHIIGTPVVYEGLVYMGVGEDPEHGEGVGHLWCIDPNRRGDVSSELAFHISDLGTPIPHRRNQAVIKEEGEVARPNPNSAAIWHYDHYDLDGDGRISFEETMHRTCGTVAIKDDLLFVADFSGLVHCVDAKTGKPHWTYDMLAAAWGSPLIADGKVYIGDEDGDITIFRCSPELEVIAEINMGNAVYSTPVVANGVLYISNKSHLFAIAYPDEDGGSDDAGPGQATQPDEQ